MSSIEWVYIFLKTAMIRDAAKTYLYLKIYFYQSIGLESSLQLVNDASQNELRDQF